MNNRWYYHKIFTTSRKFYHEIFILEQNLRNHESYLPQKFGAIRYPYLRLCMYTQCFVMYAS